MLNVFYSPSYVRAAHAFDTTRKAEWIARSLREAPIPHVALLEPPSLMREQVTEVHDEIYVRAIETGAPRKLAESQGFTWDAGLWEMVLASNGGAVAAALAALSDGVAGSLSSGLHHARRERGAGFCTFNGLVLAARAAMAAGARSVMILDLDAHCGGGTESLVAGDPHVWQFDVSVCGYDRYAPSERARLEVASDGATYRAAIGRALDAADACGAAFDLCLYNAGMDPCEGCSTGGAPGVTRELLAERERLVFEWCRARRLSVAFVLAGGYVGPHLDQAGLIALHRLTLSAAAGAAA
jgi:acetoin utilization deacetylase AcuC-like enzyme